MPEVCGSKKEQSTGLSVGKLGEFHKTVQRAASSILTKLNSVYANGTHCHLLSSTRQRTLIWFWRGTRSFPFSQTEHCTGMLRVPSKIKHRFRWYISHTLLWQRPLFRFPQIPLLGIPPGTQPAHHAFRTASQHTLVSTSCALLHLVIRLLENKVNDQSLGLWSLKQLRQLHEGEITATEFC